MGRARIRPRSIPVQRRRVARAGARLRRSRRRRSPAGTRIARRAQPLTIAVTSMPLEALPTLLLRKQELTTTAVYRLGDPPKGVTAVRAPARSGRPAAAAGRRPPARPAQRPRCSSTFARSPALTCADGEAPSPSWSRRRRIGRPLRVEGQRRGVGRHGRRRGRPAPRRCAPGRPRRRPRGAGPGSGGIRPRPPRAGRAALPAGRGRCAAAGHPGPGTADGRRPRGRAPGRGGDRPAVPDLLLPGDPSQQTTENTPAVTRAPVASAGGRGRPSPLPDAATGARPRAAPARRRDRAASRIAPSSTKWCRFTAAATSSPRPASKGTRPKAPGAKASAGSTQIAAPASRTRPPQSAPRRRPPPAARAKWREIQRYCTLWATAIQRKATGAPSDSSRPGRARWATAAGTANQSAWASTSAPAGRSARRLAPRSGPDEGSQADEVGGRQQREQRSRATGSGMPSGTKW